ncbi:4-hydroxybenzoate octaprenyltransferase [Catenovulum maritimum]|uniref:4-hydroxybenzoate octaprenyltransferase n=1 Tax=Catenovulum maritimum TaxID=1513271 RepID=A0A0J8GTQ6_9ALTE|nr:4-hydroxybenzoate octaprenyltransferase [Catenovulum maritimum]KMT66122.1 4-hydroxybenzoate polyprenyltransferase [Catenovulum maritimum]
MFKLDFFNADKRAAYLQLMRTDKPVGTYLLLWPTLWSLWIAAEGKPALSILFIFIAGVFVMRSAGCVINDFADRKVDGHVERTKNRPLAAGTVTSNEALSLFCLLIACALVLVLFLNWQTILLSLVALLLASLYPFMKRFTYLPQFVLGAAFSWSIPMAYVAVTGHFDKVVWLLYFANLTWTVAYDTIYAMVDREDDLEIGVKSTAILFGQYDRLIIFLLQIASLILWYFAGIFSNFKDYFFLSLILAGALFCYQQYQIRLRERSACFKSFLQSHYAGLIVLIGIFAEYYI